MKIKNHRLDGVDYQQARWIGPAITPEIVILHDTASSLKKGAVAAYLRDNTAKVSVHFVIEIDGTIVQQVPTNRRANHAGVSAFHGRSGCNDFAIGIELVNPGKMLPLRPDIGRTWFGGEVATDPAQMIEVKEAATPEHGHGAWMAYPAPQLKALVELLEALFAGIPTLRDITTHWYVSPGRKVDTNPLFPLQSIRARILGRDDPADLAAEAASEPVPTATMVRINAPGDSLNMRRWPSFNPNVVGAIPHGVSVPVLRRGTFDGRNWSLVQYGDADGWIVDAYTIPA